MRRPGARLRGAVERPSAFQAGHTPSRRGSCERYVMPPAGPGSQRLLVTTRGAGEPYDEVIEATLTADGDQTILVIETRGMPLNLIAFYGVGWQIHAENLAAYLAGRARGDTRARWDDLVPAYQELAASIATKSAARSRLR